VPQAVLDLGRETRWFRSI